MALNVISHDPNINAEEVPLNGQIKIKFNQGIIPSSVSYTTFTLNEANSFSSVPGELGVEYISGISDTLVYTPSFLLIANTPYRAYVYGSPTSVIGADNTQLNSTYVFQFTTGTGILEDVDDVGLPSGDIDDTVSGVPLPATQYPTYLEVSETDPQNQEPNVDRDIPYIYIKFNTELNYSGYDPALSGFVTVEEKGVLV